MSTDKLQAVHEALADVFSESPLISTDTEPSHPVFDHEALSDIFSEPHLISANTEHPFHAALAGIFSEPIPMSTNTKPSSPSFDHQALAEILSEPPPTSTNTKPLRPSFDHPALAEILSEQPPTSTITKSSPPSFDHQGLAEALSELRLVPINPELSPLSFETGSSSVPSSDQLDNEEPVAKTVAVASSTNAEGARPQRARSLLTKLHHIFSNKAEPPPSGIEKDPLPPSLSGQRHRPEPIAKASAAASPTDAESARPQQAESLLTEASPQISRNSDLPPLSSEQAPSSTRLSGEPGDVRPAASEVTAASPIGTASARRPRPTSLLAETSSLISINTDSSPPIFEKKSSPPTVAGRLDNTDPGVRTIAVAAPTDAEYARPQQAKSLLTELRPLTSAGAEPPPIVEKEPPRLTLSGRVGKVEPAVKTVAVTPPTGAESARAQQAPSLLVEPVSSTSPNIEPSPHMFGKERSRSVLFGRLDKVEPAEKTDQPDNLEPEANATPSSAGARQERPSLTESHLLSINKETSPPLRETPRPPLSGQPDNVETAAEIVAVASPANTESLRPQQPTSPLAELPAPISTDTKSSPADFRTEPSPPPLSGQSDNVGPAASTVAAVPPTNGSARPQRTSLLAELPAMISANEKPPLPILRQPSRPTPSDQLNDLEPAEKTVSVAPPTNAESAVMQPRDSKPLPSEVPSLGSTIPKPPPLIFENEPSPISLSDQPDHAEPAAKIVAASHPADTEGARPQGRTSWLAQLRPSRSFFEKERSPTTLSGELDNVAPAVKTVAVAPPTHAAAMQPQPTKSLPLTDLPALGSTNAKPSSPIFDEGSPPPSLSGQLDKLEPAAKAVAVAPPADTESAVTRAQQAKSLLAELDLNTAIRFRWVMRDIRGKRTKLSPVSDNDLTALMDLGLVEMREELPRLTALGVLALD